MFETAVVLAGRACKIEMTLISPRRDEDSTPTIPRKGYTMIGPGTTSAGHSAHRGALPTPSASNSARLVVMTVLLRTLLALGVGLATAALL